MLKIFWTASYHGKSQYQKYYDLVGRAIESQPDVEVVATEKGNYQSLVPERLKNELKGSPARLHYEAIRRGIAWADAVIIEISHESFQLGHEASLAMASKKHVLCLSTHDDYSQKLDNRYFHAAVYNKATIEQEIEDFLSLARRDLLSHRFNLFLTSSQQEFIKKMGAESGDGASQYLRDLIERARRGAN